MNHVDSSQLYPFPSAPELLVQQSAFPFISLFSVFNFCFLLVPASQFHASLSTDDCIVTQLSLSLSPSLFRPLLNCTRRLPRLSRAHQLSPLLVLSFISTVTSTWLILILRSSSSPSHTHTHTQSLSLQWGNRTHPQQHAIQSRKGTRRSIVNQQHTLVTYYAFIL